MTNEELVEELKKIAYPTKDGYCDCRERCPHCGKKIHPLHKAAEPYEYMPHYQPWWYYTPTTHDTTVTW